MPLVAFTAVMFTYTFFDLMTNRKTINTTIEPFEY